MAETSSLAGQKEEAEWLSSFKTSVQTAVQSEAGEEELPNRWTPFMDRVAVELKGALEGKANLESNVVDALKAVMVSGMTEEEDFNELSSDAGALTSAFYGNSDLKKVVKKTRIPLIANLLYKLRSRLFEGDLLAFVEDKLCDERRESLELEKKNLRVPGEFGEKQQQELGSYMKFVNREKSINLLLKHAADQYKLYSDDNLSGNTHWAACSGGPGLGKTTFCRKAFRRAAEVGRDNKLWDDVNVSLEDPPADKSGNNNDDEDTTGTVGGNGSTAAGAGGDDDDEDMKEHEDALDVTGENACGGAGKVTPFDSLVKACVCSGRQYRLSFSSPTPSPIEYDDPSMSLAWRLALAITKKKIAFPERKDGRAQLLKILGAVTKGKKESFVVVNFDETNKLLDPDAKSDPRSRGEIYLGEVASLIRQFNLKHQGYVFCIFSGTNVRSLHDLLKVSSGGNAPLEIPLPLLGTDHVFDVLNDLLRRTGGRESISAHNNQLLKFVLKVLGGVPRYIELLAFSMGKLGADEFSWESFHSALTKDDIENNVRYCSHFLLNCVRQHITLRYDAKLLTILNSVPRKKLVGYSLFEWPVTRDTRIGDFKVEDMERNGVVFLQSVDGKHTDNECKLVFPLVLLLKTLTAEKGKAPMLLQDFEVMLSSDENERNSLMIFALKAEILHEIYGSVKVGRLLPLDESKAQKFKDTEMTFSTFTHQKADGVITMANWRRNFRQCKKDGRILINGEKATFSDMMMIGRGGNFHIHFQEKKSKTDKRKKHENKSVGKVKAKDVKEEHDKCRVDEENLFVMITDMGVEKSTLNDLEENELLLTYDTQEKAFGSLLALLRAFNHHGQEPILPVKRKRRRGRQG